MRTSFSDSARNFLLVGVFQHPFRAHGRRERPFCSVMARLLLFIVLFIVFVMFGSPRAEAPADVRVPGTSAEVKL